LIKAVFDYLTHHRQISAGFWEILALMVAIAAVALRGVWARHWL
jgi:hypothetical protein